MSTTVAPAGHAEQVLPCEDYRFWQGLIEGMRCGILAIDREARLVMVNDLGMQILDLAEAPPVGVPIHHAMGQHPQLAQVLAESFAMSSLPNRAELELGTGTARRKTIGFTISLIGSQLDQPIGSAMFFKDLTHIEHTEEQERLKERLAALGQMAASLAHEIRNPLASIEVSCSLLGRRLGANAEGKELLEKIANEVRRLNRTISSSLEFVKPVALSFKPCDLGPVLEEAVNVAEKRRGRPGIRVIRQYEDRLPAFLMDRGQLRQVFENLLLNAMEAVEELGTVKLEVQLLPAPSATSVPYSPDGGASCDPWQTFEQFAVVRVSDSGPGIPVEERAKVFYPFFTTKKNGSGVGLSVVKKIVDSHRGLIDVDCAPEGGALFTVRLPMVLQGAPED
jgi:signal transduction histidine kinase